MFIAIAAASAALAPTPQETAAAPVKRLHPDSAGIVINIPDVQRLIDVYPRTPSGQLLTDPEIQAAIGGFMGEESVSPVALLMNEYDEAVATGDLPPLLDVASGLRSVSMSVDFVDGGIYEFQKKMNSFFEEGFSEEAMDRQRAYGRDGLALRVVADYADAESCAAAAMVLEALFADGAPYEMALEPVEVRPQDGGPHMGEGEVTYWSYVAKGDDADDRDLPATLGLVAGGTRLAMTLGSVDALGFMEELSQMESVAVQNASLTGGASALGAKGAPMIEFYLRPFLQQIVLDFEPKLIPLLDIAEGLFGASASAIIHGGYWRVDFDEKEGQFVTGGVHQKIDAGPYAGLIGHAPIDGAARSLALPGSLVVSLASFDKAKLKKLIVDFMAEEEPGALEEMEEQFGFSVEADLLDPLGDSFGYSLNKITSLVAPPNLMFAVELDDPEGFERGMQGVFRAITAQGGDDIEIARKTYKKESTLYEVSIADMFGDAAAIPGLPIDLNNLIRPTMAVIGDRAVITLTPGYAKKEVRRVLKIGDGEAPIHAGIEQLGNMDGVTVLGYADWAEFVGGLYTQAKTLAPMLMGGAQMPFDPQALPTAEAITKHFRPSERRVRFAGDDIIHEARSSFGPELSIVVPAAAMFGMTSMARPVRVQQPLAVPAEAAPAREFEPVAIAPGADDSAVITRENLDKLRVAITLYQIDTGKSAPPTLEALRAVSTNYPKGYLESEVPKDGWGRDFIYSAEPYTLYSVGPDGVDQQGQGDDIKAE